MKKSLMFIAALMINTVMFAQHRGNAHSNTNGASEKMKAELSLDDTQYASVKGINEKYAAKQHELRGDSSRGRNEKRTAMMALRSEREKEIKGVLTPKQKTKWESLKKEKVDKRKDRQQKMVSKHEERMKSALSLSDDQFAKVKTADKNFSEKLSGLKKDKNASREAFKKLRTEHETAIKGILTGEQLQKWDALKADRKVRHPHKRK